MPTCIVIGCTSGSGREKYKCTSVLLPKSPSHRTKWLEKINRPDYEFLDSARICHKHFHENDFIPYSKNIDSKGQPKKKRHLKPTAIPSLYLSGNEVDESIHIQNENEVQNIANYPDFSKDEFQSLPQGMDSSTSRLACNRFVIFDLPTEGLSL